MNMSQRISGALVHLPAPVTFILSQLGEGTSSILLFTVWRIDL